MKKRFSINDMTIKAKITMFSIMMMVLMILISGVGIWSATTINTARSKRYNNYAMGQYYLSNAYSNFADIKVRLRNILYMRADDPVALQSEINDVETYKQTVKENLGKFEERLNNFDSTIRSNYDSVDADMNTYIEFGDGLIQLVRNGRIEQAVTELSTTGITTAAKVETELLKLIENMEKASDENNEKVEFNLTATMILEV